MVLMVCTAGVGAGVGEHWHTLSFVVARLGMVSIEELNNDFPISFRLHVECLLVTSCQAPSST